MSLACDLQTGPISTGEKPAVFVSLHPEAVAGKRGRPFGIQPSCAAVPERIVRAKRSSQVANRLPCNPFDLASRKGYHSKARCELSQRVET